MSYQLQTLVVKQQPPCISLLLRLTLVLFQVAIAELPKIDQTTGAALLT